VGEEKEEKGRGGKRTGTKGRSSKVRREKKEREEGMGREEFCAVVKPS